MSAFEMLPVSRFANVRPTSTDLRAARRWRGENPTDRMPGSSNRPEDYEPEPNR